MEFKMRASIKLSDIYYDLKFAEKGLEQMQQPDAGYFEDFENKQPWELPKYYSDVENQCKWIEKLQKQYDDEYAKCLGKQ